MKTIFSFLAVGTLFFLGALSSRAGEVTAQAVVLSATGTLYVGIPGHGTVSSLTVGELLPQGTTITTGMGGEVQVRGFTGAVSTILANSFVTLDKLSVTTENGAVTKQTALFDLKQGSILSLIDPANHNINDYAIRTPKGIAAARGTQYTVTVDANGNTFIAVSQSTVAVMVNGQPISVTAGDIIEISAIGLVSGPYPIGNASGAKIQQSMKDAQEGLSETQQVESGRHHEWNGHGNETGTLNGGNTTISVDPGLINVTTPPQSPSS